MVDEQEPLPEVDPEVEKKMEEFGKKMIETFLLETTNMKNSFHGNSHICEECKNLVSEDIIGGGEVAWTDYSCKEGTQDINYKTPSCDKFKPKFKKNSNEATEIIKDIKHFLCELECNYFYGDENLSDLPAFE
jgi:hypothetical protein